MIVFISALIFILTSFNGFAQEFAYDSTFVAGGDLEGRLLPADESAVGVRAYQRVPEAFIEPLTGSELRQASRPVGLFYAFKTNSSKIGVLAEREGVHMGTCNGPVSSAGFDLYIKKGRRWLWAGSALPEDGKPCWLVSDMSIEEKDCILYMPLGCKVKSLQICHSSGSSISAIHPFNHTIAVFGSSFTEGSGTSRPGMTWTAQLSRNTGLLFGNFGFAGNCKMQPYFTDMLVKMDVDAYVFDCFSNPSLEEMEERLFPFISSIRLVKPDVPLVFLRSVYRENRNFDKSKDKSEERRSAVSDSLMNIAVKQFDKVYWVRTTNITDKKYRETSVDGTHPSDYGYTLWMESVKAPLLKILSANGIR